MRAYLFICLLLLGCASAPLSDADAAIIASIKGAEGSVLVNDLPAEAGTLLKNGDVVVTGVASRAQIVFLDSAVMRLDENTEIVITNVEDTSIMLEQMSGQTWSRVLKLAGVSEYQVTTSTTVATVRGTGFKVRVNKGETEVAVGEGAVEVMNKKDGKGRLVRKLQRAVMRLDRMELQAITDDSFMTLNLAEDSEFIDDMARRFAKRHPRIVKALQQRGYTQDDVQDWMSDLATGEITVEEMRATISDAADDLDQRLIDNLDSQDDSLGRIEDEQDVADVETTETEQDAVEQEVDTLADDVLINEPLSSS